MTKLTNHWEIQKGNGFVEKGKTYDHVKGDSISVVSEVLNNMK